MSATPAQGRDGMIYVGLYDQRLLALDEQGRLRWQVKLRGPVRSTPLIADDRRLYLTTVGGIVYAFAPRAGQMQL
jgi:outer membrane protein assembly factor BamB